jgi:hypothetical protein
MHAPDPETVSASLDEFRDELLGNDRTSFTFGEAEKLAFELGFSLAAPVIKGLKDRGLGMDERIPPRRVRGVRTSSNDRWFGPGSCPTSGGSGWEQISGFAGQQG